MQYISLFIDSVSIEFSENYDFVRAFWAVLVQTVVSPVVAWLTAAAEDVATLAEKDPRAFSGEVQTTTVATATGWEGREDSFHSSQK